MPLTRVKVYGFACLSAFSMFALPAYERLAGPIYGIADVEAYTRGTFSIDDTVQEAADKHRVDPAVLKSIMRAESKFQTDAVSPRGAVGLMQLMPSTAEALGYDAADPEENIHAGAAYLSSLMTRYRGKPNRMQLAIAAYNAGPGNVDRYRGIPPFRETRSYVKRVLSYYKHYRKTKPAPPVPEVESAD